MLSIIVPTYCEAENARPLVQRIRGALDGVTDYEIVFVDDNSPDEIVQRVEELRAEGAPVRLIVRKDERGLSSAIFRGFREAKGDLIMCIDADLSHPPEKIPQMLQAIADTKADIVVGSRYVPGGTTDLEWGWYRWLNSNMGRLLAMPLTKVRDSGAGFFLLPKTVFDRGQALLNPIGYKSALEITVKCRCERVVEVPIHFTDRQFGESKLNFKVQWEYLVHLKRLYDYRYGKISQFIQFCLIGFSGLMVDLSVFNVVLKCGLLLAVSRALAIGLAMTWNFFLNRRLSFDLYEHHPILPQYLRFVLACAVGALVSWSVSIGLIHESAWFGRHYNLAAMMGIAAGALFNFIIPFKLVFRDRGVAR